MISTRNRSIATNWRKNSMVRAVVDISRMALVWVVVLQILGVDGLLRSTHRWSQNYLSPVQFFQNYWERDPPVFSVSKVLCLRHMIGEIFLRKFVHLDTDFFSSIMFELRFTKFRISQESIVNPFKMPLDASLSKIMGNMIVSLFFGLPISIATRSSLLNDINLNWEKVQCTLKGASTGFTSFKRCRDARKCDRRCLDSSTTGTLCIAF